jgi:hypothetical protein
MRPSSKAANVKAALDETLDLLGPEMKNALYLHLGLKYGITFADDYAPTKEIEDALFILFESGAQPLIKKFRTQLNNPKK